MPVVWIPSLLRDLTGGRETVSVPGTTVRQVIEALDQSFPGIKGRLCDGDHLRTGMAVAVGSEIGRLGLAQPVPEGSEVHFVPSISGGSAPPLAPRPHWWGRNWKWVVPVGCLTPFVCCGGSIFFILSLVFGIIKSTDVYKEAVAKAQASPAVVQGLGSPVEAGFFVQGHVNVRNSSGNADLRIPIKGPNGGAGTITVLADRVNSKWTYQKLEVHIEGRERPINLLAGE
jgi:molybdopterin converting factor small subunit